MGPYRVELPLSKNPIHLMHQVDQWQRYNPIKYFSTRKVSRDPIWKLSVPFAVVVDYVRRFPREYFG